MSRDDFRPNDFRHRADAVRSIPLKTVLTRWGAERDRRDRSQWRTHRGSLSVTGSRFFNWQLQQGAGGAIDLVMHLSGWDVHAAVGWLHQRLGAYAAAAPSDAGSGAKTCPRRAASRRDDPAKAGGPLRLPVANLAHLERVRRYLTQQRGLAAEIVEPLIGVGKVYADGRRNAVFLMVAGKANLAVGAELRGTGQRVWRGLARGTRKDAGYFWLGPVSSEQAGGSQRIVLCESAIDAISCVQLHARQLHEKCICISTAGIRPDAPWLQPLLARGYDIHCGFDDDEPGNNVAGQLIRRHSSIKRLRPPAHDWNDALRASR